MSESPGKWFNPVPKVKRWESEDYKDFIREQDTVIYRDYGDTSDIVAHHHRKGADGGEKLKPSDIWCLPVTSNQHRSIHDGKLTIPQEVAAFHIIRLMTKYLVEKGK